MRRPADDLARFVDRLAAARGPGESYSDVILRVAQGAGSSSRSTSSGGISPQGSAQAQPQRRGRWRKRKGGQLRKVVSVTREKFAS
jgi:hypothetical protein